MRIRTLSCVIPALALVFAVAACGDTRGQRVATGALGGAAVGHVLAQDPLTGALVGGAIGALR